jgi:hypothetical protein
MNIANVSHLRLALPKLIILQSLYDFTFMQIENS